MIIRVNNSLADQSPRTYLSSNVSSGGTAYPVRNINTFQASWGVQIGATGQEQSEVLVLGTATPSGTALNTTANGAYDHPVDTPVYAIKYDQVIFKVSTSGTAGTATAITGGTLTIQADGQYTQFDHTAGDSSYAYKTQFYNSVTGSVSAESDWFTPSGPTFYSLKKLRDRVKNKLVSANYIKDDETIDDWINEWMDSMNNTAIKVNRDYAIGTVDVAFSGTAELGTITSTDFVDVRRVWMIDSSGTYAAQQMTQNDFYPSEVYNNTNPFYYMQGDNIIGRRPASTDGTARISYYKIRAKLTNDTDELPVVMRGYTKSFVDYCLGEAYYLDQKTDLGDRYNGKAVQEKNMFENEITPRHKSGPEYIREVEVTSVEDYDFY